ncbi:MAG: hypothetical protein CMJ49_10475 [Planctomycetaceae bacterium]|nr:hypothetical protein [Planctomycetaceae bacterium]
MVSPAWAVDITLDLNGFANAAGGTVHGVKLPRQIPLPADAPMVVLPGLEAGETYQVDFYHNAGRGSSDFSFTINAAGTGVAKVSRGGEKHKMVTGFRPGDTTLKLNTHQIIYNANAGQTGSYYVPGLIKPHTLKRDLGAQTWTVIPGTYSVDNLYNSGRGNEDFKFLVSSTGRVRSSDFSYSVDKKRSLKMNSREYAIFRKSEVSPRVVTVRFHIESSSPVNYHTTHTASKTTRKGNIIDVEMPITVGCGGLNIWSFEKVRVAESDYIQPDGKLSARTETINDFHFVPWLRYDMKRGFYFATSLEPPKGKPGKVKFAKTVRATAEGNFDDDGPPLKVTVTATIIDPPKPTTRPTTQPTTQPSTQPAAR